MTSVVFVGSEKTTVAAPTPVEGAKSGRKKGPPRARLTEEILEGRTGVDAIFDELSGVAFRKEDTPEAQEENLRLLLHKYEAWGRSMVPQLGFDGFLATLEKLSSKVPFRKHMENLEEGRPFSAPVVDEEKPPQVEQEQEQEQAIEEMQGITTETASAAPVQSTTAPVPPTAVATAATTSATVTEHLSEEQRQKIEQNRQRALELRKQKNPPTQ